MNVRSFTGAAAAGALLVVGASSAWLACSDDVRSHIYSGRQFDPTRGCLEDIQSIDVVQGPEPETPCAPVCVVSIASDASASILYVSTECPPYPVYPYESDAGGDPRCAAALQANVRNTSCEPDGAILNAPPEAGPDTGTTSAPLDAGADTSVAAPAADAGLDAATD